MTPFKRPTRLTRRRKHGHVGPAGGLVRFQLLVLLHQLWDPGRPPLTRVSHSTQIG
jgi:hypothetical protein